MPEQFIQGIVRILDTNGDTAGTGFVVSESGLIATCSHVIQHEDLQERGQPRPERVTIVFHATGGEQDALVEPEWWLPWNAGDLAILRVEGILPQGVQPLLLGSAKGTSGHDICTFGFPYTGDIEGIGGDGKVVRVLTRGGRSILQLRSSEITIGFSGAPVWDTLRRRVIGMVSDIAQPVQHRLSETAFAISTETLRQVCAELHLSDVCPYRGLAAFTEADSEFFFGRQQFVDSLLNRLRRDPRFLTVLGPSGSGKSSIVQAGLIPHLRSGKVPASDRWGILVTRPAAQPFTELAKQGLVDESQDLTEHVQVWLSQHAEQERLVLVIDQFEDLFSSCPEAIRQDFITQLVKLLHSSLPITIILVMRNDFYSCLTQQEALVEWLERSRGPVHVPKLLKPDELITIVQKPAEAVGLKYEEGLVQRIVEESVEAAAESEGGGQSGRSVVLPLLEFALTELWSRRREGMFTHDAYRDIGGVAGALTQWADRAFYTLKYNERQLAQRVLIELVYIGDESQGVLDSRRRRALNSLSRNEGEQGSVQRVVQHFTANRLLVTDRDLQSNKETVEIVHDVLLREWELLQGWLEEDRRFLRWRQELEKPVDAWATRHDNNKLYRGRDLTEAKGWLKERAADLSQGEVAFIHASFAYRVRFVGSIITVFLLLVSSLGIAGWLFVTHPDPKLVTTLQDNVTGSLRYCIDNAPSGSTITFAQNLQGTIHLTRDLVIENNLTIRGPGGDPNRIVLSGDTTNAKVHILRGVTITVSDLSFKDSQTRNDAFLYNEGILTLIKSIISHNKTVSDNTAYSATHGGSIENEGRLTVIDSVLSNNTTISNGNSDTRGGGIYNDTTGMVTVTGSKFLRNTTSSSGGSSIGGGIYNLGQLSVTGSTFFKNTAISSFNSSQGGGIYNGGQLIVTDSTFSNNSVSGYSGQGGSIENEGKLSVTRSTFSNNSVSGDSYTIGSGGGIDNNLGQLIVTDSTFSNNSVSDGSSVGGGIYNSDTSTVTVSNSTFSENRTNSTSSRGLSSGGGVYTSGKFTVSNSTFWENIASSSSGFSSGGGIFFSDDLSGASTVMRFCTMYGNMASVGGGIQIENTPPKGYIGIPQPGNHLTISGSIVAANTARDGPDISGTLISDGYNLLTSFAGVQGLNTSTDREVKDADLKITTTLHKNGGFTPTLALLAGSPAIDMVPIQACLTTDQRGMKRPDAGETKCDIGAYESS